ncbi:MAG TPA: hypothetical protein PLU81_13125 [Deltaproteobacteria bacterium]|nr:hypothetical protein [Deltaproteobacteria bacterium]HPJ94981.1 hypothetical protein [Deltaproteobacteria bacterium]HPR52729.1 hypothetical protein [Deltaproteobacteria bacterium]
MVVIVHSQWLPEGAVEMGKRFKDQETLADYITMKGPFIHSTKGEGIQAVALYEFDRARLADAVEHINNRYVAYYGVPGFTYTANVWLDVGEALSMVGL